MEQFNEVLINFEMNILQNQTHCDLMSPRLLKMNSNGEVTNFMISLEPETKLKNNHQNRTAKRDITGWKD